MSIQVFCDNMSTVRMTENLVQNDKSEHVEIDRHFIREKIKDQSAKLENIASKDQIVDILTKPVSTKVFQVLLSKLFCKDIYKKAYERV